MTHKENMRYVYITRLSQQSRLVTRDEEGLDYEYLDIGVSHGQVFDVTRDYAAVICLGLQEVENTIQNTDCTV